jgi:hypothetical protein
MSFEIGRDLETSEPVLLKMKDVVASRTYIASETRFGKSHLARRIAEKILKDWAGQVGVIIVDLEGEYPSLREKYAILIIGRDVPIQVETPTLLASTAEFMAQQVLETGTSAIIDLSVVEDVEDGKEYVDKFLRRFFHLQTTAKKPYLVIVEEAEDLAPESGAPGTRTCLEISITLARRGGKRGIGVIYVGHRPAWISKGILAQCPNKAIGRIESPDMKALEEYARIPHNIVEKLVPKTSDEGELINPGPERGVFCFTGDWVQKTTFVKVGPVETTHLGATPDIIPRPVGDIEGVIANVKKALSEVIEKTKPVVASQNELASKIRSELESKYKGRIETLERTAVERAERKYRVKIDELQAQLGKVSRSQAMQPTSPITDVLEHPIVKARMLQLDEKSRDLLTWIEKESGHTREELAARMVSSKDVVASLVDKINRVFQLQVIVDDGGRPIRYKSMLKRLFLTDVAKREINELARLQGELKSVSEEKGKLLDRVNALDKGLKEEKERTKELPHILEERRLLMERVEVLKNKNGELEKKLEPLQKIESAFGPLVRFILEGELRKAREEILASLPKVVNAASIDEGKLREIVEAKVKDLFLEDRSTALLNDEQVKGLVEKHVKEVTSNLKDVGSSTSGAIPTSVELEHKVTHFDFTAPEEHVKADSTTLLGRIIWFIVKTDFWATQHKPPDVVEELANHGWVHEKKDVGDALLELCQKGIFYRKVGSGNYWWYSLTPESKELIHA